MLLQEGQGLRLQVRAGQDAEALQLRDGRRPYAMELLHRERLYKHRVHVRRDDGLAVRLGNSPTLRNRIF